MNKEDNSDNKYDIIIVGAGMVGLTLACQLTQDNPTLQIAVVEAQVFKPNYQMGSVEVSTFDPRVVALTAASQKMLEQLGVWEKIKDKRACAYTHMSVWDGTGTGKIEFDCSEVAEPVLGHIVENSIIVEALLEKLAAGSVDLLCPAKVSAINLPDKEKNSDKKSLLLLEDGRALHADLIVATDGANSKLRELANIETREWSYGHTAIVCTVEAELAHQHTARQCFTEHGPLAFLPLQKNTAANLQADNNCAIVWSVQTDYAETLLAMNDADFSQALGEAFEYKLGKIEQVSKRFSFPLKQRHCKDYFKPGLVVAGDAAHTIHPLAGQGVNLGLQDAKVLAEEIQRTRERDIALSDSAFLARYQRRRKGPNLAMMAAMEGFKQLFSQKTLLPHWLRNESMRQLSRVTPIKQKIIREAMGI